jgi:1-acyl-sn-glycerol-3-phosphate acyltransferase
MNRQPYQKPPRWWSPKPSRFWVRFWRGTRRRAQIRKQRVLDIEVRGLEHVRQALDDGCGVLITPNHASHADCYSIYDVADQLGMPFYVMIAWQNFARDGALRAEILRQHGGFSVDREGNDLSAFRQALTYYNPSQTRWSSFPKATSITSTIESSRSVRAPRQSLSPQQNGRTDRSSSSPVPSSIATWTIPRPSCWK